MNDQTANEILKQLNESRRKAMIPVYAVGKHKRGDRWCVTKKVGWRQPEEVVKGLTEEEARAMRDLLEATTNQN